jgi:hypothetical protein
MPSRAERGRRAGEWWRTAEAVAYLATARLALAVLSFQRLTWLFERPARRVELTGEARIRMRHEVRRALNRVRRRLPSQTTCFHRAIAAQAMLRRRGVGTTLYYGAARLPTGVLATHAWVQDGTEGVVGYRAVERDRYHVLARYRRVFERER